jgi:hypothetical protein
MPRRMHSKKQVCDALDEAAAADFNVMDTSRHGHSWGYIHCLVCGQKFSVSSTPRNADNHAEQIRRFMRRHHHNQEDA